MRVPACRLLVALAVVYQPHGAVSLSNSIPSPNFSFPTSSSTLGTDPSLSSLSLSSSFPLPVENHTQPCLVVPVENSPLTTLPSSKSQLQQQQRPQSRIPILEYHSRWVCVNKPAGLTVHRSHSTPKHQRVLVSSLKRQLGRKVFPVHRLDHRTSGAMLLAFDSETCGKLHDIIRSSTSTSSSSSAAATSSNHQHSPITATTNTVRSSTSSTTAHNDDDDEEDQVNAPQKQYIALVRGIWKTTTSQQESILVDQPVRVKDIYKPAQTKFTILATMDHVSSDVVGGGGAGTPTGTTGSDNDTVNTIPSYYGGACSLVLCEPLTGRTHQIRKHAFAMGHPIIGDTQHGDTKINCWWRTHCGLNRLALHSWRLTFEWMNKDEQRMEEDNTNDSKDQDDDCDSSSRRSSTATIFSSTTASTAPTTAHHRTRHTVVAPLPPDFQNVFLSNGENLLSLWKQAIQAEPDLALPFRDMVDGSHGRNYKRKKSPSSSLASDEDE
jgi:tRNA pseudouridine65 synthase